MNRSWLITILACLLIVGAGLFVVYWPRVVPYDPCSDAYKKYANVEGIEATFIKDFRINDTLTLDVTVLKAVDTNAWNMLKNDFSLPVLDSVSRRKIDNGKDLIFTKYILYTDSTHLISSDNKIKELVAFSYLSRTITIFYLNNDNEREAIWRYNYPSLEKKSNTIT